MSEHWSWDDRIVPRIGSYAQTAEGGGMSNPLRTDFECPSLREYFRDNGIADNLLEHTDRAIERGVRCDMRQPRRRGFFPWLRRIRSRRAR